MSRPPTTCWTCRLRKKKCDKKRPACNACLDLGITCDQGAARPTWMDSSRQRRELTQRIKAEIKQKSELRKERHYVTVSPLQIDTPAKAPSPSTSSTNISPPSRNEDVSGGNGVISHFISDIDLDLQITYLDHVFPFFFPFYSPSIFEGGRSWVLASLRGNTPLFHTAMSLTTYFFALILHHTDDTTQHIYSKKVVLDKLACHFETAIKSMQQGIDEPAISHVGGLVTQKACLMEGVVQLLVFGTGMGRTTDAHVHIAAAASLFKDIFDAYGTKDGRPDLHNVLDMMRRPDCGSANSDYRTWNNEQGAFRFFVAVLLYIDVISSTVLGSAPQLQRYHSFLIDDGTALQDSETLLRMEEFVGCPGWILLLISEITSISARRRPEVTSIRANRDYEHIGKALDNGVASLYTRSGYVNKPARPYQPCSKARITPWSTEGNLHSLIWAHAAKLYLFITTSGWKDQHEIVREGVSEVLRLLQRIPSTPFLRNVAWPFCVAGCLATEDQEHAFRDMVRGMGALQTFGTAYEALNIMERVWKMRGQMDMDSWDFGYWFRVLESTPLLI